MLGRGPRPGVERSGTPGNRNQKITRARDSGRQSLGKQRARDGNDDNEPSVARSTGWEFNALDPGVPLRSTPGRGSRPSISAGVRDFMLPPTSRVRDIWQYHDTWFYLLTAISPEPNLLPTNLTVLARFLQPDRMSWSKTRWQRSCSSLLAGQQLDI